MAKGGEQQAAQLVGLRERLNFAGLCGELACLTRPAACVATTDSPLRSQPVRRARTCSIRIPHPNFAAVSAESAVRMDLCPRPRPAQGDRRRRA